MMRYWGHQQQDTYALGWLLMSLGIPALAGLIWLVVR